MDKSLGSAFAGQAVLLFVHGKAGHVNPCVPIVEDLVARGANVTVHTTPAYEEAFFKVGAITSRSSPLLEDHSLWNFFLEDQDKDLTAEETDLVAKLGASAGELAATLVLVPQLLKEYEAAKPALILYDPQCLWAKVLAKVLGVASATINTFIGPGSRVTWPKELDDSLANVSALRRRSEAIQAKYGLDPLAGGRILRHWAPVNFCTSIEALAPPVDAGHASLITSSGARFVYVGPLAATKTTSTLNVAEQALVNEVGSGSSPTRKVILCAFGTNVTSGVHWGKGAEVTDSRPGFGAGKTGEVGKGMFGRPWCHTLWRRLAEGLAHEDVRVVLGIGGEEDAVIEGFEFPDNFIVRRMLPQKALLPLVDCFITHGGANSLQESLIAGTPMVVMPYFGDQWENGETVMRLGVGHSFDCAVEETTSALCEKVLGVARDPCYKVRAQDAQGSFDINGIEIVGQVLEKMLLSSAPKGGA